MNNKFEQPCGILACCRYAFMPNKLQYCGGDRNRLIFDYTAHAEYSPTLNAALGEFETLCPYLKLIASANKIADIFDARVVEAYWIGNDLLRNVQMKKIYNHFVDGLHLKRKIKLGQFEKIVGKIPRGALPHHSFHVFNIWQRTGHLPIAHTIETMDNCRIGWGKIIKVGKNELEVSAPGLKLEGGKLILSEPENRKVIYKMLGQSFVTDPAIGEWVSFHWGWVCDRLTEINVANLKKYTEYSLALANLGT